MYSQQAHGRPEDGPQGQPYGPHFAHGGRCGGGRPGGGRFGGRWGRHGGPFGGGGRPVPVNIEATNDSFVLTLFAAGLDKARIQLAVQNDVLAVSYTAPAASAEAAPAGPRYTRREFRDLPFERAFQLNGKVLTDQISARYADGILTVTLPKNPAANQPAQDISVS